jgi:hypothetical protein
MKHPLLLLEIEEVEVEAKVEAKNFAPKNGHLGRTELLVQPAI